MTGGGAPPLKFGDFGWICNRASLTICPALGLGDAQCYSRSIGINNFLLFQPSLLAIDVTALLMTCIMIYHIKSKYTAVGRKEMVIFFYLYMICVLLELLLATNVIPLAASLYKYFAAGHVAAIIAAFGILLLNGFVGFQWTEDGTKWSVWTFRIAALVFAAGGYFIAIATFLDAAGMSRDNPVILYVALFIFNGAALLLYILLQIFLVLNTLTDRWPLGDIFFGVLFFGLGMAAIFGVSNQICQLAVHYVDGMFLGSAFVLLAVMMVYKYWDSITTEDLEFSVGGIPHIWHLQNTMDLPMRPGMATHSVSLEEAAMMGEKAHL